MYYKNTVVFNPDTSFSLVWECTQVARDHYWMNFHSQTAPCQ